MNPVPHPIPIAQIALVVQTSVASLPLNAGSLYQGTVSCLLLSPGYSCRVVLFSEAMQINSFDLPQCVVPDISGLIWGFCKPLPVCLFLFQFLAVQCFWYCSVKDLVQYSCVVSHGAWGARSCWPSYLILQEQDHGLGWETSCLFKAKIQEEVGWP